MSLGTPDKAMQQRLEDWAQALDRIGSPCANDNAYAPVMQMEQIVQAMEARGRWKEARVLRVEYSMATQPEAVRLAHLRRKHNLEIGRSAYYEYLRSALAFVEGSLSADNRSGNILTRSGFGN